ncbi:MAG: cell division protein SepF [Synechococcaceae bacterium WB6_3B_236]|nr:cell division protein SepF [Synechococcaceae bacterium WB6_3B_236]
MAFSPLTPFSAPYGHDILVLRPLSDLETELAVVALQAHSAVVVDLSQLEPVQAQRFVDFVSGALCALDGEARRISDRVFLFAPSAIHISS